MQHDIILDILGGSGEARAVAVVAAARVRLGEFNSIVIPIFVFAQLLIGSSVIISWEV